MSRPAAPTPRTDAAWDEEWRMKAADPNSDPAHGMCDFAMQLELELALAQAEIKGHMRTEDDLKADYVRAREFIEQQSTRIAELEGALGNAVEALHNDFEPDNQSRAYHAARNALKARA